MLATSCELLHEFAVCGGTEHWPITIIASTPSGHGWVAVNCPIGLLEYIYISDQSDSGFLSRNPNCSLSLSFVSCLQFCLLQQTRSFAGVEN